MLGLRVALLGFGYTGLFFSGKLPFYYGKLYLLSMTNIAICKCPDTNGYVKKITRNAIDI